MDSAGTAVRSSVERSIDRRDVRSVGRKARLELVFTRRGSHTCLSHAYAEPPFRVGRCFSDGSGVHLILAWSAPGIFGGDDLEQHISVEKGACVRLTSQSALQVHPSAKAEARLLSRYQIDSGAFFSCHWDPMIPFAGASLDQQIAISLASGAALYWSDAFMAGREAKGERWAFDRVRHELRIARGGGVEYLERYQLEGADQRLRRTWLAAGACYFGTTVRSGGDFDATEAEALHRRLAHFSGVTAAVDALDSRLLLVRLMGSRGVPFHDARALAREALAGA